MKNVYLFKESGTDALILKHGVNLRAQKYRKVKPKKEEALEY
jgi:hypothetical protein